VVVVLFVVAVVLTVSSSPTVVVFVIRSVVALAGCARNEVAVTTEIPASAIIVTARIISRTLRVVIICRVYYIRMFLLIHSRQFTII
jgi:hypothetical protein